MANSYTQFSSQLKLKNADAADWIRRKLIDMGEEEDPSTGGPKVDFEWEIGEDSDGGWFCWFHDNGESGNIDQIAEIVKEYLGMFDRKGSFVLEWANTCSKPRVNQFGGGKLLVTAKEIHTEPGWVKALQKKHKLTNRNS